jgi:ABC-type transporter Mla MlaB component
MAFIHCTWRNKALIMHFKGKMTVDIAPKIKKGLIRLFNQKASVYYADFSEVTDVDITFVQLLIAFYLKIQTINSQLYIIQDKIGNKLLDDLKIIGIDLNKHFLIREGSNEFAGK